MTALAWALAAAAVLLIWTGVTGQDPRQVLADVFTRPLGPSKARGVK